MEENRLTPMGKYDPRVFKSIYKDTEKLRKKLAYQIDHRRFGVDYQEILSWFDVKFIFVFNKYYPTTTPEELKAHIIKSLQFFKNRILRKAYSKSNIHNSMSPIEDIEMHDNFKVDIEFSDRETLLKEAMSFLRKSLSQEAYYILQIELHPPLYILRELQEKSNTKIPSLVIADYLGWGTSAEAVSRVDYFRKEAKAALSQARMYFQNVANI